MKECDYCTLPTDELWVRPNRAFGTEFEGLRLTVDRGHWAACALCRQAVNACTPILLAIRVEHHARVPRQQTYPLYRVLFDSWESDVEYHWREGDPHFPELPKEQVDA